MNLEQVQQFAQIVAFIFTVSGAGFLIALLCGMYLQDEDD